MKNTENRIKSTKKVWPTKAAMEQVYEMKLWGEGEAEFYSGEGSHHPEIIAPYIAALKSFFTSFKSPLVVCDLGCGDFNVGKQLVQYAKKYVAVDIVADLIAHHKANFKAANLEFHCLDIAIDDLPSGDCVVIRQVLQHLSNAEVQQIVPKLAAFKYVILTEHLPMGNFVPNKDILSGQGTRLKKQSGLQLTAPPFNFKVKQEKELVRIVLEKNQGLICTKLYTLF